MVTHTYTHTYTHTHTHTYTHDNYYNPRCAHAHRGLIIIKRLFEALQLNRYNTTYSVYVCKTAQHEAHALIRNNN